MDPLAWWDIAATYDRYSGFFDLAIYCSIFIALAQAALGQRFPGRPGRALAGAMGIALGISLTLAERRYGWNLRQAGPIAAFILLVLMGILILHVLVQAHVAWKLAAPLTYVLLYLFVRALSPDLFDTIVMRAPFLHLLSIAIFLACVWQFGVALWHGGPPAGHAPPHDAGFITRRQRAGDRHEARVEKRVARPLARGAQEEVRHVRHDLKTVFNELRRDQPAWSGMTRALARIGQESGEVLQTIERIRVLDRRLENFDLDQLNELKSYCGELSDQDRDPLRRQIHLERAKILQEHAIGELAERCERRQHEFRSALDEAAKACSAQDRHAAQQALYRAIALQGDTKHDLNRLRRAENRLLALTRMKLRTDQ